jgi:hypothetical protein
MEKTMSKLTKKQLQSEIASLESNIQVHEALIGDAGEAKKYLAILRTQLHDVNFAELNSSLENEPLPIRQTQNE